LDDRGRACIFVGYAQKHAGNVYRMLNVKTNAVIVTRDVNWLNKMWYEQGKMPRVKIEFAEMQKNQKKNLKLQRIQKVIQRQRKVRIWKGLAQFPKVQAQH